MSSEAAFLRAIEQNPSDASLRLAFSDWLEERGDPRGEVLRTLSLLTQAVKVRGRKKLEERLRALVASGVQPVGPFFTNSIGMRFALIWPGTFIMGSPENEKGRQEDERQHQVTLTTAYFIATHPVSRRCWKKVVGTNPSDGQPDYAVERVSWNDCQKFLRQLTIRDRHSYRMPTEAEWEYACRAGTTTPFCFGKSISRDQANDPDFEPPPNAWGLHYMHGNVCEWCSDWYGAYPETHDIDPQGPPRGQRRIMRSKSTLGFWGYYYRSAMRSQEVPSTRSDFIGFRPVLTLT